MAYVRKERVHPFLIIRNEWNLSSLLLFSFMLIYNQFLVDSTKKISNVLSYIKSSIMLCFNWVYSIYREARVQVHWQHAWKWSCWSRDVAEAHWLHVWTISGQGFWNHQVDTNDTYPYYAYYEPRWMGCCQWSGICELNYSLHFILAKFFENSHYVNFKRNKQFWLSKKWISEEIRISIKKNWTT